MLCVLRKSNLKFKTHQIDAPIKRIPDKKQIKVNKIKFGENLINMDENLDLKENGKEKSKRKSHMAKKNGENTFPIILLMELHILFLLIYSYIYFPLKFR